MAVQPFAVRKPSSATDDERGAEQLEAAKTAALTRMHPDEVGRQSAEMVDQASLERSDKRASLGEGRDGASTDFQLRINSIESSLDGGVATFQGEIQIEEYLNNEFISRITIILSVTGDETMRIGEVETRLLQAARARLREAGSLSVEQMQMSLKQTRRDEDIAYSSA
jgi:hypothetical protein